MSYEYLENTKELPPRSHFYSSLTNTTISQDDYESAVKGFKLLKCRSLKSYGIKYCHLGNRFLKNISELEFEILKTLLFSTDTLLLAQALHEFRMEYYNWAGLDPTRYLGMPSFAYDCFLKISGQKIGLLTERDMFTMYV